MRGLYHCHSENTAEIGVFSVFRGVLIQGLFKRFRNAQRGNFLVGLFQFQNLVRVYFSERLPLLLRLLPTAKAGHKVLCCTIRDVPDRLGAEFTCPFLTTPAYSKLDAKITPEEVRQNNFEKRCKNVPLRVTT